MILEIVTPETYLLSTEVDSVAVPGTNGSFEMLNQHASIVSSMVKGVIKFKGKNVVIEDKFRDRFTSINKGYQIEIDGGIIEMKNNKITILVD
jgi:F-type H+-transporting ATPase subunit epsilon